jgi:hypothetical protein
MSGVQFSLDGFFLFAKYPWRLICLPVLGDSSFSFARRGVMGGASVALLAVDALRIGKRKKRRLGMALNYTLVSPSFSRASASPFSGAILLHRRGKVLLVETEEIALAL